MEERRLMAIDLELMTATDGVTIYGAQAGDWSGVSVSKTGDVNGDGYDDMFIGAVYSANGSKLNAGASYLLYGGPALPATLDLANLGTAGVKILGADAGDASGAWVTAADLNADGFKDLIIGSPSADGLGNARANSGETHVIFGSQSLPSIIDLSVPSAAGLTIYGAEANDESGSAIAGLGDVNGDGYDDFIIGASKADGVNNLKVDSGESYLIYGGANLPTTIDLASLQPSLGVVLFGVDASDGSGVAVAGAGDINADGFKDFLIGAVKADGIGNTLATDDTGEAYLIYGSSTLPTSIVLSNITSIGVTIYGAVANTLTGIGLSSAGDVNGDNFDDFLVGTYLSDGPNNNTFAVGAANLIFGSNSLASTINLAQLGQSNGTPGIIFYGDEYYDLSGWSVASAGDINDDGLDDLLISAPYARAPGDAYYSAAGKTYVILGSQSFSGAVNLSQLGSAGFPILGADVGDISGWSVSGAGDVNGDGFSDYLVGAPEGDSVTNARSQAGESYLIYGGRTSAITHPGTTAAETLTGTLTANNINGARGNDTLISGGGADLLFGGEGNDIFDIVDLNFARITGGNGSDTLRLSGSGITLDLTAIANNRLRGIEQIDIRGSGNNTLTLNDLELLNLSDESNTLLVRRDSGDTVNIDTGWTTGGTEIIDGITYQIYTKGAATLKLQVTNQAPTAIVLTNVISSIAENTATTTRIKVADLNIIDDGAGTNNLTITGPDAAQFEIDSGSLYLKSGTLLDYETKTTYTITLQADDPTVGSTPDATASYTLNVTNVNEAVLLTVTNPTVTGTVLSTLTNTGTWSDPESGSVTMSASVGSVTMNSNGTWSWSYTPSSAITNQIVTITARDSEIETIITFTISASAKIEARRIFYNQSAFDGNSAASNANDDLAIATDKTPLLPGQLATFANYTSYSRGINGIMIDVAGLATEPTLATISNYLQFRTGNSANPSSWTNITGSLSATNSSISVRPGVNGASRVVVTFATGFIAKKWLQVTVLANSSTGLGERDVHYWGNAMGDSSFGNTATRVLVDSVDISRVLNNPRSLINPALISNTEDYNRDRRVDSFDVQVVLNNPASAINGLLKFTAPTSGSLQEG